MKTNNVGILGFGEVGRAMAKFYSNPKIKDLIRDDNLVGVEILNVCIPWSEKFVEITKQAIKDFGPKLVIIHSTVAPGTTKELSEEFSGIVVHSPVRGVHPNLYEGIKTFIKYIGAENKENGDLAKNHFDSLGIKSEVFFPSVTTELGKILDTTYYGVCIAWHKEMKKICSQFGVDFENSVTKFNQSYNEGYSALGKKNVVRPVLFVDEKPIGGHCVIPNAEILNKYFKSESLDLVLKYKNKG